MSRNFTETDRLGRLISRIGDENKEIAMFYNEISDFLHSPARREMLTGERYYRGKHDILGRKRTVIGADGNPEAVTNLPNNRIVDNQYARVVDQKVNYILGKPLTIDTENPGFARALKGIFGPEFRRTLRLVGEDAFNCGIGWLHPCYDREGRLSFRRLAPYEVLPFWADDSHRVLDCAVRVYEQEHILGLKKDRVLRAELYTPEGLYRFTVDGGLIPDGGFSPYYTCECGGERYTGQWPELPLVPFRAGGREIPLVRRVKALQDGINDMLSDFENRMQEDSHNTILVIKNYDGENLGEFRRNLAAYGAVKVRSAEGADGGVETLSVNVDAGNFDAIISLMKKALIENAKGFDIKDISLSGSPNQMAIQSMYADMDLDAGAMELEFSSALRRLLDFVCVHLESSGMPGLCPDDVEFIFNRDVLINESESIDNCVKSKGLLSEETIVYQHPWTSDAEKELERLKKEN